MKTIDLVNRKVFRRREMKRTVLFYVGDAFIFNERTV